MITSLFAIPGTFLYEIVGSAGIDKEKRTVTHRGDVNARIAFSRAEDVAKAVVSVATRTDYSGVPDKLFINSGEVTMREIVERYEATHNVQLAVAGHQPLEEAVAELQAKWLQNGYEPNEFLYYLHVLSAAGLKGGLLFTRNDNELVNPGEKLWKWGSF